MMVQMPNLCTNHAIRAGAAAGAPRVCDSSSKRRGQGSTTALESKIGSGGSSGWPLKPPRARRALSIVEMLMALAITAMLLTATMVAIDASFKAYADTVAQSSTQTVARMVTYRLMTMLRTSTAHGPLIPDASIQPPITLNGQTITSHYLELVDSQNNLVRVEYRPVDEELWATLTPLAGGPVQTQPLLGGVTDCTFYAQRRLNQDNVLVLERATMDLTIQPSADATMGIEQGALHPIRMVASTMPRQLQ